MSSYSYQPKRVRHSRRKRRPPLLPLIAAAVVVCLGLIIIPSLPIGSRQVGASCGGELHAGAHSYSDTHTHAGTHPRGL